MPNHAYLQTYEILQETTAQSFARTQLHKWHIGDKNTSELYNHVISDDDNMEKAKRNYHAEG